MTPVPLSIDLAGAAAGGARAPAPGGCSGLALAVALALTPLMVGLTDTGRISSCTARNSPGAAPATARAPGFVGGSSGTGTSSPAYAAEDAECAAAAA